MTGLPFGIIWVWYWGYRIPSRQWGIVKTVNGFSNAGGRVCALSPAGARGLALGLGFGSLNQGVQAGYSCGEYINKSTT